MLPIALAWGGFAARKTHLALSDSQPQLKALFEKGRKNAIARNIRLSISQLVTSGKISACQTERFFR
jgi:hypothetical protein